MLQCIITNIFRNYILKKIMSVDKKSKIYLIGGGIASLSSAVYLIKNGNVEGKKIKIFDWSKKIGWCLDAKESPSKKWYVMRGVRIFEEKAFSCTFDLMSNIPSLTSPWKTLREEFTDFNEEHKNYCKARLIKNGKGIDWKSFWLSIKDKFNILKLFFSRESTLGNVKIEDFFTPEFLESNFWYDYCSIFAFSPWHSVIEFRRYMFRSIHVLKYFYTLEPVVITPYNQYESLILPTVTWLEKKWVKFIKDTKITNLEFKPNQEEKKVSEIHYNWDWKKGKIIVNDNDFVFVTVWSMVANSTNGSMKKAPIFKWDKKNVAWSLWKKISKGNNEFWKPKVFNSDIEKSKWVSFTITFKDNVFYELMQEYVEKNSTSHWSVSLTDSNWFITIVLFYKPYFVNQPKEITLSWGYSLFPDKKGNYIKKKMSECTGKEILTELIYHLKFEKHLKSILKNSICIPSMTPYVTSHLLPRKLWDRPQVVPKNSANLAFLWQFCEIPNDVVFTVEYSVRSAQIAVNTLLKLNKEITPIYKGIYNIKVLFNAFIAIFR